MRKIIFFTILILVFIYIFTAVYASSVNKLIYDGIEHDYNVRDITLMLNNDKFEPQEGQMPPIILEDRTLVPVREVFEYLGGKVDWDGQERRVDVSFDDKKISLWIDNKEAKVNGNNLTLDVPAKIINDKTMVPARFISEQADLMVGWDGETYTVDIKFQPADVNKISFAIINGINCMVVSASNKITGYKYFSLPKDETNDFRLVLDVENSKFSFDTTNAKFDSGIVSGIRFGNQGNGVNRIVIDLRDETDYVVTMSKDRTKLYFAMAEEFVIPGEEENSEPTNNVAEEDNKKEEPIEIPVEITQEESGEEPVDEPVEAPKEDSGESTELPKENSGESKPAEELIDISNEESGDNIIIDTRDLNSLDDLVPFNEHNYEEDEDEEPEYDVYINSIKYSTQSERVKIKYTGTIKYDDMVLTNPNRVVIDIANAKLDTSGPTEIEIKNSIITSIRFSQYTPGSVRIVIDLKTKGEYSIYKRSSELQVSVKESTYKNIKYKKNSSNSQITLQNVDISKLSVTQEASKFKYIIKYKTNYEFGQGQLNPDDEFVNSITIEDGQITILDTGTCKYAIRQSNDNVIITIRKDNSKPEEEENIQETPSGDSGDTEIKPSLNEDKKIIMIDVGHGGTDPGACNGDAQEKVYNLSIAMYLYDMLKERDDIEVYIDRKSNDTYLNREDRVAYATKLNPDFIISIHNNSLENKSYSGTMVLYFNNDTESDFGDVTSKECAEIIVRELVGKLGTINRGVVNRGDLHILSKTPCPSILCEVCFISNDEELERLKTKSFQKDAAQAMYDGIDKILEAM